MSDIASLPTDRVTPSKRRWTLRKLFQFRLRTLLLLTAAIATLLAWHLRQTQLQREAVAKIAAYGGWVHYDFEFPTGAVLGPNALVAGSESPYPNWLVNHLGIDFFHNVVEVNLVYNDTLPGGRRDNSNLSPEILTELDRLPNTRLLLIKGWQADDEYMTHVGRLKSLQGIYMWDASRLTDAGVAQLSGCPNLEEVHINDSQITDDSLAVFGRMSRMRRLSLQFHSFSDVGVLRLQGLRNLQSLWLCVPRGESTSRLTDASVKVFDQFPALTELGIQNTAVTPDAISEVKRRRPGCVVFHSQELAGGK